MVTVTVLTLVAVILAARAKLVSTGDVKIEVNGDPDATITAAAGDKLLQTLAAQGLFLSSACGGGGTCAQCKCKVLEGRDANKILRRNVRGPVQIGDTLMLRETEIEARPLNKTGRGNI